MLLDSSGIVNLPSVMWKDFLAVATLVLDGEVQGGPNTPCTACDFLQYPGLSLIRMVVGG
jgi:hypothetical protein